MKNTNITNLILPASGVSRCDAESSVTPHDGDDDLETLNPIGRVSNDRARESATLLKAKKTVTLSTFNTRTLRKRRNLEEVTINFKKYGISVLGIQEHRRVHEDEPISYHMYMGQYLVTSSAWRNSQNAAVGGVGMLLNPKAKKALGEVKSISNRILKATFQGNPATTIIVAYSPTNVPGNEEEVDNFYVKLREATESTPKHNLLAILGDFNAHLDPARVKYTYHEESSRNGEYLLDFAEEQQLTICNCSFKKKQGKMWTFIDPKGLLYQKDYILVNNKWRNSVNNAEAYSSFSSVGSDHRVVSAAIRLSLRSPKDVKTPHTNYDWKVLRHDTDLQERYTAEVRNRYESLFVESDTPTEKYGKFVSSTKDAAKEMIPVVPKTKSIHLSDNPRVSKARINLQTASKKYEIKRSKENRIEVKACKQAINNIYEELEEKELTERINDINQAHVTQQHGKAWKLINDITGRKNTPAGKLNAKSQEERKKLWYDHFSKLLGEKPTLHDEEEEIEDILVNLGIDDGPFTMEEYKKAVNTCKEGKSPGEDGIVPELLKRCNFDDIMLDYCNRLHIQGEKPDQWAINNIKPLPKKGDLGLTGNYRGISLSVLISKICNRMILNRIRPEIDPKLRENQNGFREGRTTTGQILALRRLIEGIKGKKLPAVLTFIDFSKAFDSINREKMFKILRAYGVPPNLLKTIKALHTNTKAKVLSPDGETDLFDIVMGVLQGDTLAPFLFVIVLDYAMRKAIEGREEAFGFTITPRKSRRNPARTITDLDFADDIALISNLIDQAQELLSTVEEECKKVGLEINAKKTKYMAFNITDDFDLKIANGTKIERALTDTGHQDFKYLGSWVDSSSQDIRVRKAQAWSSLNKMSKMWTSNMSKMMKINLFKATVESVLLYGCETWTLNKKLNKSIDGCYTRMLRKALNISWQQHMTNEMLYGDLPRISQVIRKRRLKFSAHCFRQYQQPVSELVLWDPKQGTRRRGCPEKTFIDILKADTGLASGEEIATCMKERDIWRKIVSRCSAKGIDW